MIGVRPARVHATTNLVSSRGFDLLSKSVANLTRMWAEL